MMDVQAVAAALSGTVGLPFSASRVADALELQVADGQDPRSTFAVRVELEGRALIVRFVPGRWAGDLVRAMGLTDDEGRRIWKDLVARCAARDGRMSIAVEGATLDPSAPQAWPVDWRVIDIRLARNRVALDDYDRDAMGLDPPSVWVARFGAALAALLPIEAAEVPVYDPVTEGAAELVTHLRYERSRRNRAAAIAIHGLDCKACGCNMGRRYGAVAAGYIQVHHVVPLSSQGGLRDVDPYLDLVPLCPGCHAVAHLRRPPYTVEEIRTALASSEAGSPLDPSVRPPEVRPAGAQRD